MRNLYDEGQDDRIQKHRNAQSRKKDGDRSGKRGPDVEVRVPIAAIDLENGNTIEFQWEKQHICKKCDGSGSEDRKKLYCPLCRGKGTRVIRLSLAPGVDYTRSISCNLCGGAKRIFENKCSVCGGAKVIWSVKTERVTVDRGASRTLVLEGRADESPYHKSGDLIVRLVEVQPTLEDRPGS